MSQKVLWSVIIAAILIIGGWLLLSKSGQYNQAVTTPLAPSEQASASPVVNSSPTPEAAVEEITVDGSEFKFEPAAINLSKGVPVKLTFNNKGKFPHNLVIADLNVTTKTIQPNQSDTIEFTPDKTGSFGFICSVDAHADKGMKGTATVE